ncbi:MAG: radical SAM protein, partial [Spirochaetes bacterium]|nr:radical SAM protein [Spirochaetota bacterium]
TPTHFVPQLAESIKLAALNGLSVPIVYNCGGYESVDTIRLLDGIVDIYMPDIKYSDDKIAEKYSDAPDYFKMCRESVKEMHRQVGDLEIEEGIAGKGLLIRHLVLPNRLAGTEKVMEFIGRELSKETYVNIMFQYHPQYHAQAHSDIRRPPLRIEFDEAVRIAGKAGLHRGFNNHFS